ncbi:MAG: phosphatase PAP2 family protein [Methylococcaceae bacterium]
MYKLFEPPLRYFSVYLAALTGIEATHFTIWSLLFCLMLAVMAGLAQRHARQRSWRGLAAICVALGIGMNVSYQAMAGAVPAVRTARFDAELLALDRWLLGETPSVCLQQWISPWLTDLMSACYLLLMPLLLVSLLRYFFRQRDLLGEFYTGLFTVYGLGFLGYLTIPAAGPWLAYPELFNVQLSGSAVTMLNQMMVEQGSNKVDVWPSLHVAVTLYVLGFAWRHHRFEFWLLLLPVLGLWLATFYLRYHYFVDVVSGLALACFGLYEARRHAAHPAINPLEKDAHVPVI